MKANPQCSICIHPDRVNLAEDYALRHFTAAQIQEKYFPRRGVKSIRRALKSHKENHRNIDEDARIAVTAQMSLPTVQGYPIKSEERVFSAAVRERLEAAQLIEHMLLTLIQRANMLEDEFIRAKEINAKPRCEACGRGGDMVQYAREERNLARVIAIFNEIRKQLHEWKDIKNPITIINELGIRFAKVFMQRMNVMYQKILIEKANRVSDAVEQHLEGKMSIQEFQSVLATLNDREAGRIITEAQNMYLQILQGIAKEIGINPDSITPD